MILIVVVCCNLVLICVFVCVVTLCVGFAVDFVGLVMFGCAL